MDFDIASLFAGIFLIISGLGYNLIEKLPRKREGPKKKVVSDRVFRTVFSFLKRDDLDVYLLYRCFIRRYDLFLDENSLNEAKTIHRLIGQVLEVDQCLIATSDELDLSYINSDLIKTLFTKYIHADKILFKNIKILMSENTLVEAENALNVVNELQKHMRRKYRKSSMSHLRLEVGRSQVVATKFFDFLILERLLTNIIELDELDLLVNKDDCLGLFLSQNLIKLLLSTLIFNAVVIGQFQSPDELDNLFDALLRNELENNFHQDNISSHKNELVFPGFDGTFCICRIFIERFFENRLPKETFQNILTDISCHNNCEATKFGEWNVIESEGRMFKSMELILLSTITMIALVLNFHMPYVKHQPVVIIIYNAAFCFGCSSTSVLFLALKHQISYHVYENPCDLLITYWKCLIIKLGSSVSGEGLTLTHAIICLERSISVLYPSRYEKSGSKFGIVGLIIMWSFIILENIWKYLSEDLSQPLSYCNNTTPTNAPRLNAMYFFLIATDVISLTVDIVITIINKKHLVNPNFNHEFLSHAYQLKETSKSMSIILPLSIAHSIVLLTFLFINTSIRLFLSGVDAVTYKCLIEAAATFMAFYVAFIPCVYLHLRKKLKSNNQVAPSKVDEAELYFQLFNSSIQ